MPFKPLLLVWLGLAGLPLPASGGLPGPAPGQECACPTISPDAAAAAVRRATGGQVLGVQSSEQGGRPIYAVKVLLEGGRVRVLRVDACTGQLLG